jgi:hypothetical protein
MPSDTDSCQIDSTGECGDCVGDRLEGVEQQAHVFRTIEERGLAAAGLLEQAGELGSPAPASHSATREVRCLVRQRIGMGWEQTHVAMGGPVSRQREHSRCLPADTVREDDQRQRARVRGIVDDTGIDRESAERAISRSDADAELLRDHHAIQPL